MTRTYGYGNVSINIFLMVDRPNYLKNRISTLAAYSPFSNCFDKDNLKTRYTVLVHSSKNWSSVESMKYIKTKLLSSTSLDEANIIIGLPISGTAYRLTPLFKYLQIPFVSIAPGTVGLYERDFIKIGPTIPYFFTVFMRFMKDIGWNRFSLFEDKELCEQSNYNNDDKELRRFYKKGLILIHRDVVDKSKNSVNLLKKTLNSIKKDCRMILICGGSRLLYQVLRASTAVKDNHFTFIHLNLMGEGIKPISGIDLRKILIINWSFNKVYSINNERHDRGNILSSQYDNNPQINLPLSNSLYQASDFICQLMKIADDLNSLRNSKLFSRLSARGPTSYNLVDSIRVIKKFQMLRFYEKDDIKAEEYQIFTYDQLRNTYKISPTKKKGFKEWNASLPSPSCIHDWEMGGCISNKDKSSFFSFLVGIILGICILIFLLRSRIILWIFERIPKSTGKDDPPWKIDSVNLIQADILNADELNEMEENREMVSIGARLRRLLAIIMGRGEEQESDTYDKNMGTSASTIFGASMSMIFYDTKRESLKWSNYSNYYFYQTKNLWVTADTIHGVSSMSIIENNWVENDLIRVRHNNLATFYGISSVSGDACAIYEFCQKGRLSTILEYKIIDAHLKLSFLRNLVQGLGYLHSTDLICHGRLSSHCCLVDLQWNIRISDYGLEEARSRSTICEFDYRVWRAPELLRSLETGNGTQAGDIYSFGIICQEVAFCAKPFFGMLTDEEIVRKVADRKRYLCRPEIARYHLQEDTPYSLLGIMRRCWREKKNRRPKVAELKETLDMISGTKSTAESIENMQRYNELLETVVEQRMKDLEEGKSRTKLLLSRMMPSACVERLLSEDDVPPEYFSSATICFVNISNFSALNARVRHPADLIELLDIIFDILDEVTSRHKVYHVDTIRQMHLYVSGLPQRTDRHASIAADTAIDLLLWFQAASMTQLNGARAELRIGISTGPCIAALVGSERRFYTIYGDTVNLASRMESTGEASKAHISSTTAEALMEAKNASDYSIISRGATDVKGKGPIQTFWLNASKSRPTPQFMKDACELIKERRNFNRHSTASPPLAFNLELTPRVGRKSQRLTLLRKRLCNAFTDY
ncbi:unnamed protein product [Dimorphilus gyrociliatus]|uniref:guanylate cyclase n=1 Tax=Dimorphilus gyrociliatus TaxID=2664684 RepID=A0A7I8VQW9_9ANNE|nr:unnamed protein product [Dimorphilus gyrociliatus]